MKFLRLTTAAVLTGALIATLSVAPASATTADTLVQPSTDAVQQAVLNAQEVTAGWEELPAGRTQSLVAANATSLETESGLALESAGAEGWKIDRNTLLVRVPIAEGQGVIAPSAVTLFLTKNGRVTSVVESTFTPTSETTGLVQAWVNGSQQVNQNVGEPIASSASSTGITPMAAFGSGAWWQALNTCLANQGVPAWIVTGLSIICAAACAVTAGVGCVLCIAAAAGFSSGVVYACVDYANRA